jgi:rare lipoprotein A
MPSKLAVQLGKVVVPAALAVLLTSCLNSGHRGDFNSTNRDGPPQVDIDISTIADAIPRVDPVTAAGNKNPYTINGITYRLLPGSKGYREVGVASWYGSHFHGNPTSNGEIYSMYGMTAAHKTLPIPVYVKVRNLDNNSSVIVRVNDRGPFHDDRLIDLSYVAAKKLGYAEKGTAKVEVMVIDPDTYENNKTPLSDVALLPLPASYKLLSNPERQVKGEYPFLQVGAYLSYSAANRTRDQVLDLTSYPVAIRQAAHPTEKKALFKVLIGPVADQIKLRKLGEQLAKQGYLKPFIIFDSLNDDLL